MDAGNKATASVGDVTFSTIQINGNILTSLHPDPSDLMEADEILDETFDLEARTGGTITVGNVNFGTIEINLNTINGADDLNIDEIFDDTFEINVYDDGSSVTVGNVTLGSITVDGNLVKGDDADLDFHKPLEDFMNIQIGNCCSNNEIDAAVTIGNVSLGPVTATNNIVENLGDLDVENIMKDLFEIDNRGIVTIGNVTVANNAVQDASGFGDDLDADDILRRAFDIRDDALSVTDTPTLVIGTVNLAGVSIPDNQIGLDGRLEAEHLMDDLFEIDNNGGVFGVSGGFTQGGDFNNTTDPLTVTGAVAAYPDITFAVDTLVRIEAEVLKVTAVTADVTFDRGEEATTTAAHADGVAIYIATEGGDFNNTDDALTVTGAVATYPDITFVAGTTFIRIDAEVLKVTTVTADVTFARGQVGTTNVAHPDGAAIEIVTTAGAAGPNVEIGNVTAGLLLIDGNTLAGRAGIDDRYLRADEVLDEALELDNEAGNWTQIGTVDLAGVTITNNDMGEGIELDVDNILRNFFDIENYGKVEVGDVTVGMVTIEDNVLEGPQGTSGGDLEADEILGGDDTAFEIRDFSDGAGGTTVGDVDLAGVSVSRNDIGAGGELDAQYISQRLLDLEAGRSCCDAASGSITVGDFHMGPIAIDNNTIGGDLRAMNILKDAVDLYDFYPNGNGGTVEVAMGASQSITYDGVSVSGNQGDRWRPGRRLHLP